VTRATFFKNSGCKISPKKTITAKDYSTLDTSKDGLPYADKSL
jgi:hypothetical protein